MGIEQRQSPRKTVNSPAWVNLGGGAPARDCLLVDISDTGARLELGTPAEMPPTFALLLSANGTVQRQCQIVWRSNSQVGVQFCSA